MKILVTGGAGFIGSHLCERLLSLGHKVSAIDNFDPFYPKEVKLRNIEKVKANANFRFFEADIRDAKEISAIFRSSKPEAVIHLAAKAGVRPSLADPAGYQRTNVLGTINMLEASRASNISNFIFGSSSSVYGDNKKVPFSEADRVDGQISPYAQTKRSAELYCKFYARNYGMPITCLRFFTVYGPRQRPDLAIHKFTKNMLLGKPVELFGDVSSSRDYTYVGDIVDGITACLDRKSQFEIFNLGNSSPIALSELVSRIEKATGKKAKIRRLPSQPGDVRITYADISKAKKMLGYSPKFDFDRGLSIFVDWMKNELAKS
ncbi:MAG: GDP-mannose 4,6-dehydratase [Candidatus Micrarchaeota archaeon]|nr:GDP-mannose 4,6-dehydratase [Candidatus Micrarchaeota archaeon]